MALRETLAAILSLYRTSTHLAELKTAVREIETLDVSALSTEHKDQISDLVQGSLLSFVSDVGNILHGLYTFDPFIDMNIPSALCDAGHAPFCVTVMFGRDLPGSEVVDVLHFTLYVDDGRCQIRCV